MQAPTSNLDTVSVALEWGQGDFRRFTTNRAVVLATAWEGTWRLVDLGLVTLPPAASGAQQWEGRVTAWSKQLGDSIDIDWLMLIPADEGSGVAASVLRTPSPTAYSARDDFTSTTAGVALNGRVAPVGGTWATSGVATDFAFVDSPVEGAGRSTAVAEATPRYAILGSTNYQNVTVQMTFYQGQPGKTRLIARWTDSNNYVALDIDGSVGHISMKLIKRVAGVETDITAATSLAVSDTQVPAFAALSVNVLGGISAEIGTDTGGDASLSGFSDPSLAVGGALATGLIGFSDRCGGASPPRIYDSFTVYSSVSDAAVFANQSLEVRHDGVRRESPDGTVWVEPSSYVGDYLRVPPSGPEARTLRTIVKLTRGPVTTGSDSGTDDLSARLFVTPRYL